MTRILATRAAAALAGVLALAACTPGEAQPPATSAPTAPLPGVPLAPPGTTLPPADREFRYVGRWAATPELCETGAWVFEAQRLTTAGEVACDFGAVTPVPGGYTIAATCTAEAPPTEHTLHISFAESARAMLIEGGPFEDAGLIYCGP